MAERCADVVLLGAISVELMTMQFWKETDPKALDDGRVEFASLDFLNSSPKVGCDVCYVSTYPSIYTLLSDWHAFTQMRCVM